MMTQWLASVKLSSLNLQKQISSIIEDLRIERRETFKVQFQITVQLYKSILHISKHTIIEHSVGTK